MRGLRGVLLLLLFDQIAHFADQFFLLVAEAGIVSKLLRGSSGLGIIAVTGSHDHPVEITLDLRASGCQRHLQLAHALGYRFRRLIERSSSSLVASNTAKSKDANNESASANFIHKMEIKLYQFI